MYKIPILAYHGIGDESRNAYNISVDEFTKQMRWLYELQYKTLTLNELEEFHPDTSKLFFILTFDDGYKSNFNIVLPILKEFGFKAIFFISTGLIERNKTFMNWQQVRELHNNGHSIQSHSHSHRFLNHLAEKEVIFELKQSSNLIKENTRMAPTAFSCPGGRYNKRVIEIAKETGYKKMFTSKPYHFMPERNIKSFSLGRFMITKGITINNFKRILEGHRLYLSTLRFKYHLKYLLKISAGDNLYHSIWQKNYWFQL
jgi:peptidoglycan/xylan/chitin deacetylase (PgdA/CDA1 family)